ncbi:hypothetical protein HPB51_002937 [Rhipicephalus microplus]|uniref:Uncharacterized protein n=1 Tax=Rhipicephalus microplus TaxID=6941 RepID=A0A9J6DSS3_RHIMP|nr:hypothetical protein HPB51_002937 [Rhipicephalus microplus]
MRRKCSRNAVAERRRRRYNSENNERNGATPAHERKGCTPHEQKQTNGWKENTSPEDLTVAAGGVRRAGGQRFNSRRGQHRNAESGSVQLERGSGERRRRGVSGSVGTSCSAFDSPGRPSALQKARALSFVFFEQDASSTLANRDRNESGSSPQRDEAGDVIDNWVMG